MEPPNPFLAIRARYDTAVDDAGSGADSAGDGGSGNPFASIRAKHEASDAKMTAPGYARGLSNAVMSGATFGFDDEIAAALQTGFGFLGDWDAEVNRMRAEKRAFAKSNPYSSFAGEVIGGLPTLFIPGLGGVSMVEKGRKAATLGNFLWEGAKTGAKYGAVAGVGNADPDTDASLTGHLANRALGGAAGTVIGAGAGAGLGAVAKGVNTVANHLIPGWNAASDALPMLAKDGTAAEVAARRQALKDIALELRRDSVDPVTAVRNMLPEYRTGARGTLSGDQIETLVSRHLAGDSTADIAKALGVGQDVVRRMTARFDDEIRPRFDGGNVLDAIRTPTRPGEVVAAPNTFDLARMAAQSEGRGRQVAMQRLLQREADEPDAVTGLIRRTFGADDFDRFAKEFGDETQVIARRMYGDLHDSTAPVLSLAQPELAGLANSDAFKRFLNVAVQDAMIRGDEALARRIMAGQLDPRAVDLIQRKLREAASSVGDTTTAGLARTMRDRILSVADTAMPTFWGTRGWYRNRMAAEEAFDLGRRPGPRSGHSGSDALLFWRKYMGDPVAERPGATTGGILPSVEKGIALAERELKTVTDPERRAIIEASLQSAKAEREQIAAVVGNFRMAFGQSLIDALSKRDTANQFLKVAQSKAFKERVLEILGRRDGADFLARLDAAYRQSRTLNTLYGNSDTARAIAKRGSFDAIADTVTGMATLNPMRALRGMGDMVSNRFKEARFDRINEMLSETDMAKVFEMMRVLRDHMGRQQIPSPGYIDRVALAVVDRLPVRLRDYVRGALGNEVRGNDLMQFLTAMVAARTVPDTMAAARGQ